MSISMILGEESTGYAKGKKHYIVGIKANEEPMLALRPSVFTLLGELFPESGPSVSLGGRTEKVEEIFCSVVGSSRAWHGYDLLAAMRARCTVTSWWFYVSTRRVGLTPRSSYDTD